jgi:hypothetical protein
MMMNDAITYEEVKGLRGSWKIRVRLDGKLTGEIRQVEGGFQYFPKGGGKGYAGELFKSVSQVQANIEGDDTPTTHPDEGGRG